MQDEDLEARFLEAWHKTGDEYLTRRQIAKKFGYSDGWVQLMLIKTQAPPRKISIINRDRMDFGLDLRRKNREKNLSKYWIRRYLTMLTEAEETLAITTSSSPLRCKADHNRHTAIWGLVRQFNRLQKLAPDDPLIYTVEVILNERL